MDITKIILRALIAITAGLMVMPVMSAAYVGTETTAKLSVENFGDKELEVNYTNRGVYNPKWEVVKFGADSIAVISIPTDGVEFMTLFVSDVKSKQRSLSKSIYLLPGTTEVNVDPLCDDPIKVKAPTGNPIDGEVADALSGIKDIYYGIVVIGRSDDLGIKNDSVASMVSSKLNQYIDSVCGRYSTANPELQATLRNSLCLGAMQCFLTKYNQYKGNPQWDAEFGRLRSEIDLSTPENAIYYHYPNVVRQMYSIDTGNNVIWSVPDSLIAPMADYAVETLSHKAAEAVIGDILNGDGANAIFSQSVPAVTERFKELYPQSALIPMLEGYAARNIAFNNPINNKDIHFRDNSSVKTVVDILSPYKGRRVLIDIWATWCHSCIAGFSHVAPIQKYAADNGIQLLYISLDDSNMEKRWKDLALAYNLIGDHIMTNPTVNQEIYDTFGRNSNLGIPLYAIVDSNGNITILPQYIAESRDFETLRTELDKIK